MKKLQHRDFYRSLAYPAGGYGSAPDHRVLLGGVIPDFLTIRQLFEFRSVEIGRWVTQSEQEQAGGLFFDALCDLTQILAGCNQALPTSKILKLRRELISLRGTLGLQYGTGGRPGVAAHYSPLQRNFALAKNAGPGCIAHEWFHAFDHYIAAKAFASNDPLFEVPPHKFGASLWLDWADSQYADESGDSDDGNDAAIRTIPHRLNDLLMECYKAVMLDDDGVSPSRLCRTSVAADKKAGIRYYSLPEEMCARAFEAFIQDAPLKNNFLVAGTKQSKEAELGLYPQDLQRSKINLSFANYFKELTHQIALSSHHSI